ncbi:MAG: crossover junction endodeoxyribonuclease RuvC [Myxococcota bacterium]
MRRIIGIDPGSRKTGVGIIDYDIAQRKIHLVHATVLRLDLETELHTRLGELAERLQSVLELYQPHHAVLEDVFSGEHPRAALILGQARGACLAMLGLKKIEVTAMAPRKVKQAMTGTGSASKDQVGEMVRVLLKLDKKPAEDAGDALALAMSHLLAPEGLKIPRVSAKKSRDGLMALAQAQGLLK